jgi:2-methylcitrate dehydratase
LVKEKDDYEGFHTRPATWGMVQRKFEELSSPHVSAQAQREIINRIAEFENVRVADLLALLTNVKSQGRVAA